MRTSQNTNLKKNQDRKRAFTKYMQEKLAITVIVITLALFALVYVLYQIVQQDQERYNQIVLSQQEYDSRVIPYRRGDIVDRNGTYLATSEKVYNLILDPKQIMSDQENYLEASLMALATVFGYDPQELRTLITSNPDKYYIRYARQLNYDAKAEFETLVSDTTKANREAGSKARVKGVWFEEEYKRIYPYNSLACSVIGFATSDGGNGNGGIEQSYNNQLIGINGREYGYLNDDSNLERVIKSASNGNTVVSTIDVNVQNIVEKYINEWQQEVGSERIAVIVMDPNNAEVLAMSSDQMFDLNNPRDLQGRYTDEEIRALGLKEARSAYNRQNKDHPITAEQVTEHFSNEDIMSYGQQVAWNQVWRNYCISDTFEPGSPSKIFTVAAGLEEGVLNGNESFMCDGGQEIGGWYIKCVKKTGHGMLTLAESLMQSCNDCMMQIAQVEGRDRFSRYQKLFGFGAKTGIDLPGEADTKPLIYHVEDMKPSDLATNAFGQNFNCTMIQMAAAYCSVINGGSYYEPRVVKQIINDQGSVVKKENPNLVRETVSESTSKFIKDALHRTVTEGTGKAAAVPGYAIAGKTGTAEKYPRGQGNYLVSFCGYAPADDPQVLVYVIIDTPHVADQPHSSYAGEVFQKIMAEILPYLNVFPEGDYGEIPPEFGGQLPEHEGITDNTNTLQPTEPKVYETDEYVDQNEGRNSGIPDDLPGGDAESGSSPAGVVINWQAEETSEQEHTVEAASKRQTHAETTKRQTQASTAEAETTRRQTTQAATTEAETTKRQTQAETSTARTTTEAVTEPVRNEASEGSQPGQIPVVEPNPG